MLKVVDLSYRINKQDILNGLSLNVGHGQFYALAGENGAGKSTLIKITLDLIRNIESGKILIDGIDHRQLAARDLLTYLPEKFDIRKEATGWQYLRFVFGAYRQNFDRNRVLSLCEQLALDATRLDHRGSEYSKGMKQKLGLISCFMLDKPLIILDEPLSGLDPRARYLFKQLLQQERTQKRTIFYSTHMLADAEEICDRFGILHRGRIVFDGSPAECLQQFNADSLEQAYMRCISA
jgi:ABC-2 type transport system ATP-binding protein